jgi:hypothetical protein
MGLSRVVCGDDAVEHVPECSGELVEVFVAMG